MTKFVSLGHSGSKPSPDIDVFPNPGAHNIVFTTHEFHGNCPVTGQPDFYSLTISYEPDDLCIETKSLKLYLQWLSGREMFAEAIAVEISEHLGSAVSEEVDVRVVQNIRGGIVTEVNARVLHPDDAKIGDHLCPFDGD